MAIADLDEMANAGTDVWNDFSQNDRTSARFCVAYDIRSGSGPCSLPRRRSPRRYGWLRLCRNSAASGERNGESHDASYDARYRGRFDAGSERDFAAAGAP